MSEVAVCALRVTNFRDLGGYLTADGGPPAGDSSFESDGLHQMTAPDLMAFGELGVSVVYDLRAIRSGPRNRTPSSLSTSPCSVGTRPQLPPASGRHRLRPRRRPTANVSCETSTVGVLATRPRCSVRSSPPCPDPKDSAVYPLRRRQDRTGMARHSAQPAGVDRDTRTCQTCAPSSTTGSGRGPHGGCIDYDVHCWLLGVAALGDGGCSHGARPSTRRHRDLPLGAGGMINVGLAKLRDRPDHD